MKIKTGLDNSILSKDLEQKQFYLEVSQNMMKSTNSDRSFLTAMTGVYIYNPQTQAQMLLWIHGGIRLLQGQKQHSRCIDVKVILTIFFDWRSSVSKRPRPMDSKNWLLYRDEDHLIPHI